MKGLFVVSVSLIVFFFLWSRATGQSADEQFRIESEKWKALEKTELKILEGEGRLVVDYGGWINVRYDDYDDDDNDTSTEDSLDYTSSLDIRLWMKSTLKPPPTAFYENEHSFYIRLKDLYIDRQSEDQSGGYDHDGPHLDYAYLTLDFRPFWFEPGRRYFSVGQGIAYGNVGDGAALFLSLPDWNLKALFAQTLPHEENIDFSVPGSEKTERKFYGFEGTYLGIPDQSIYGYILVQRDSSQEDPVDPLHDFTFDSEYMGLGAEGKILPTLHYRGEIIKETGKSHVFDTKEVKDVSAWGGDFAITYYLGIYGQPNISFEYGFGSGDEDRISVTDTLDGNTFGKDRNFLYFGYLPTGYAFSPRLSNLHFYRVGFLFKPLEKYHFFENLTIGADYYRYYKEEATAGISDPDAGLSDDDLGSEIDLNISWQIFSDLDGSLEYGHFVPGNAFPESANDSEDYFSVSLTITF